jgi:heme/copper-type cytochrome/quinol oxidase subunit 2
MKGNKIMENVLYVLAIITMAVIIVSKVYSMYTSIEYKKDRKIRKEEKMELELNYVERDFKKRLSEFEHKLNKYDNDLM